VFFKILTNAITVDVYRLFLQADARPEKICPTLPACDRMTRLLAVAFKRINELTRISIIRLTHARDSRPLGCFGKLLSEGSNFVHCKQNYTGRSGALCGNSAYIPFSFYKSLRDLVRESYVCYFNEIRMISVTIYGKIKIYNIAIRNEISRI